MGESPSALIKSGKILVYRLYDVAYEIDLAKVEETLKQQARRIRIEREPFSKAFEFANAPVAFQLQGYEKAILGRTTTVEVRCKAYDYGVLSIILEIPLTDVGFGFLKEFAIFLDRDSGIDTDFRAQLDVIVSLIRDSMSGLKISRFEEDYTIFYIEALPPGTDLESLIEEQDLAGLLLYQEAPLSDRMKSELLSLRFSFFTDDSVILNYDNALIVDPAGSMDIPDILEFANAQLLELRTYDHIVDREMDYIYRISSQARFSVWNIKKYETHAARVMRTITELTEITERIDNSLKVTEDVYYAKIYRSAMKLFRTTEWEDGIRRKLDLASRSYDMISKGISAKRTELLEFTIVLLILVEIVLLFLID
ncbi:MAG: hypothetical protein ACWGN7_01165 [Thermodesulfovibrionales bacterium]